MATLSPKEEIEKKKQMGTHSNMFCRAMWIELAYNTGQQNLTFLLAHEEKYVILIERLTLNSNV